MVHSITELCFFADLVFYHCLCLWHDQSNDNTQKVLVCIVHISIVALQPWNPLFVKHFYDNLSSHHIYPNGNAL